MKRILLLICVFHFAMLQAEAKPKQKTPTAPEIHYDESYVERLLTQSDDYLARERIDSAITKADSAVFISVLLDKPQLSYRSLLSRGIAFEKHKWKSGRAEADFIAAAEIARESGKTEWLSDALNHLYTYYSAKKKYDKALNAYTEQTELIQQSLKQESDRQIGELRDSLNNLSSNLSVTKEVVAEKDSENDDLRILLYIAAGAAALLLVILIISLISGSAKRKKLKNKLERNESEESEMHITENAETQLNAAELLNQSTAENEKLRYLMDVQLGDNADLKKSIAADLTGLLRDSRQQLELMGKEPGGKLAVDKFMNLQNLLTKASHELRKLTGSSADSGVSFSRNLEAFCTSFDLPDATVNYSNSAGEIALDENTQHLIFEVLKEILKNIREHSEAGNVNVLLKNVSGGLLLEVNENGRGFDVKSSLEKGAGIRKVIAIMTYLNGSLDIVSEAKKGTQYTLTFKKK